MVNNNMELLLEELELESNEGGFHMPMKHIDELLAEISQISTEIKELSMKLHTNVTQRCKQEKNLKR